MSKHTLRLHPVIHGTLLLTAAGFLSRILGFFYRIFLSNQIGAEGMGIYQLIFPVFSLCHALSVSAIQTAISRHAAYDYSTHSDKSAKKVLYAGLFLSVLLSAALGAAVYFFAKPVALHFLKEERCIALLQIMALSLPLGAVHSSINGYYYGIQRASVPALSQLAEQLVRVLSVYLLALIAFGKGLPVTPVFAVYGMLLGEAASVLFCLLALSFLPASTQASGKAPSFLFQMKRILLLAVPLSANRLFLCLFQGLESVCFPVSLQHFGFTSEQALGAFGVLSGMAMPFILFPSALTNSIAVMLLPAIAQAQAAHKEEQVKQISGAAIRYSLLIGILFSGIFLLYGKELGILVYHDETAGLYISILAWLCPFLYLATTAGSILHGLEKTGLTFFQNILSLTVRIGFVLFVVPRHGIFGYLAGLLVSQLFLAAMHLYSAGKLTHFSFSAQKFILEPLLKLLLASAFTQLLFRVLPVPPVPDLALLLCEIAILCLWYLLLHTRELAAFVRPPKTSVRS